MGSVSEPLNREFPNKDSAVEDGMPVLCSIFFGFCGVYFAAVCIVKECDLGTRTFSKAPLLGPFFRETLDFHVKYVIMTLAVLCCACFYLCIMAALYAKMYNTGGIKEPPGLSQEQMEDNRIAKARAERKRKNCINLSIIGFNLGIFFLPLSLFVFLPDLAMSVTVVLYLISVALFFALKALGRRV
jgi:cell division protein FtsW (lipid II flippase)